jgi:hypothetical protein
LPEKGVKNRKFGKKQQNVKIENDNSIWQKMQKK